MSQLVDTCHKASLGSVFRNTKTWMQPVTAVSTPEVEAGEQKFKVTLELEANLGPCLKKEKQNKRLAGRSVRKVFGPQA